MYIKQPLFSDDYQTTTYSINYLIHDIQCISPYNNSDNTISYFGPLYNKHHHRLSAIYHFFLDNFVICQSGLHIDKSCLFEIAVIMNYQCKMVNR